MTRVTLLSMHRSVLGNTQDNLQRVAKFQEQLASGKRIGRMSDDPVGGRRALSSRIEEFQVGKYLDNIEKSMSFMDATDSTMSQMLQIFDEAKAIAVQGANGTQDEASRAALAQSSTALLDRLVDLTNTVHDGRYIFSGTASLTRPFELNDAADDVIYHGDLDSFQVDIGFSTRTTVNQNGFDLWKEREDVFEVLIELRDGLLNNDSEASSESIAKIDVATDHINTLLGEVGGRAQRLDLTRDQLTAAQAQLNEIISREEDVDMAETIMLMQNAQIALEASLQSGSRVIQPTLLDFL